MKVAIISRGMPTRKDPLNGIFEFDQAKALAKKGIEVAFVVIDFRAFSYKRHFGLFKYRRDGVHVFELSLPLNVYRRAIPFLQRLLLIPFRAMLKSFGKPDVVHAHFYSIAAIASILKKKYGLPFVITEHSSKLNRSLADISALDQKLTRMAYSTCDRLICVSETLQSHIKENFDIDSIVIRDMVDDTCFSYHGEKNDTSPFVYVSVGNLIPLKGFDRLIEAYAEVSNDARLLIIGDGPEKEHLRQRIDTLGLSGCVELMGQLERNRINEIFQNCHAFVLNSSSETFGVSCIEAMLTGLPVVVTRCGGPESFMNDSNGILVPVNDKGALVDALRKIRADFSTYNGSDISQQIRQRFSPASVAEDIIGVYQALLR